MFQLDALRTVVGSHAAIRRRRRLQPVGGPGDKIFPPTYPGGGGPVHVFEVRRRDGRDVVCVLIDSVQSQANRLEEALLAAAEAGSIRLPRLVVDFAQAGLNSVASISSLDAPHRIFDAILRDSNLGGVPFRDSPVGLAVREATGANATAVLEASPTALLFGAWNSTGEGGGLGAKFARAIVSEIVGIGAAAVETTDRRTGEIQFKTGAKRTGSRIDPLGIVRSVDVFKGEAGGWDVDAAKAGRKAKKVRPSEINHGNIAPTVDDLGATVDYVEQMAVITIAGLRRLKFGDPERDLAARTYLAALGLVALAEQDAEGYALRSRCDLVPDGPAPLQLVAADGSTEDLTFSVEEARSLHEAAFDAAVAAGFRLDPAPVVLVPQDKLVHIVRESQKRALSDEAGEGE